MSFKLLVFKYPFWGNFLSFISLLLKKQYRDVQASTSKIVPGPSSTYDGFDDMDENTCEFSLSTICMPATTSGKLRGDLANVALQKNLSHLVRVVDNFLPLPSEKKGRNFHGNPCGYHAISYFM